MKKIENLTDFITAEYNDANKYIVQAEYNKNSDPKLADLYFELANEEISHANRLHEAAVSIIERLKQEGATIPNWMLELYEILHKQHVRQANEVEEKIKNFK